MGYALQVTTGEVTNPSSTFTALTVNSGDSFTVPNFTPGARAGIIEAWTQQATKGQLRIRSPKLHDNVYGVRMNAPAATIKPLMGFEIVQALYAQDNLTVEMTGGTAEVDMASYLTWMEDLPGAQARLVRWSDIQGRIANMVGIQTSHAIGGTAGFYSGAQALNANDDRLQANTDYAVLGYLIDTAVCTVSIFGPDTSNLRCSGPGSTDPIVTRNWFYDISEKHDIPAIPIINSANKGVTTCDVAATVTTGTALNTWILAQLKPLGV